MYKGPDWFTSEANDDIYTGIYRELGVFRN